MFEVQKYEKQIWKSVTSNIIEEWKALQRALEESKKNKVRILQDGVEYVVFEENK